MARVSPTWQGQGAGATWHPLLAFSACSEPHPRGMTGLPPLQNRGPEEGAGGPACGLQPSVPSPHLQPSWDLGRRAVFPPKPFGTVIQVPRDECWVLSLLLSTTETQTHPGIPRASHKPSSGVACCPPQKTSHIHFLLSLPWKDQIISFSLKIHSYDSCIICKKSLNFFSMVGSAHPKISQ